MFAALAATKIVEAKEINEKREFTLIKSIPMRHICSIYLTLFIRSVKVSINNAFADKS